MHSGALVSVAALTLAGCGYSSAMLHGRAVDAAAVRAEVPEPALAACLTRQLRLGLSSRGGAGPAEVRLEATLVEAEVSPGALEQRERVRPIDRSVSLVLRARAHSVEDGEILFGPRNYRVSARALVGEGARRSRGAVEQALSGSCHEVARQVVDDLIEALARR